MYSESLLQACLWEDEEKNSNVVFDIKLYQKAQQLMQKCKVQKKKWCLVDKRNKGHFRNLTIPQNKKHEGQRKSRKTKNFLNNETAL